MGSLDLGMDDFKNNISNSARMTDTFGGGGTTVNINNHTQSINDIDRELAASAHRVGSGYVMGNGYVIGSLSSTH